MFNSTVIKAQKYFFYPNNSSIISEQCHDDYDLSGSHIKTWIRYQRTSKVGYRAPFFKLGYKLRVLSNLEILYNQGIMIVYSEKKFIFPLKYLLVRHFLTLLLSHLRYELLFAYL